MNIVTVFLLFIIWSLKFYGFTSLSSNYIFMAFQSMDYERLKRKSSENNKERERENSDEHILATKIFYGGFAHQRCRKKRKNQGLLRFLDPF
jgi:hypothetical protein